MIYRKILKNVNNEFKIKPWVLWEDILCKLDFKKLKSFVKPVKFKTGKKYHFKFFQYVGDTPILPIKWKILTVFIIMILLSTGTGRAGFFILPRKNEFFPQGPAVRLCFLSIAHTAELLSVTISYCLLRKTEALKPLTVAALRDVPTQ